MVRQSLVLENFATAVVPLAEEYGKESTETSIKQRSVTPAQEQSQAFRGRVRPD